MDDIDRAIEVLAACHPREIQRRGWHFQKNNYYSALNDCAFLESNRDLWDTLELPEDIDWNIEGQLATAKEVGRFVDELRDVPETGPQPGPSWDGTFHWVNGMWNNADAIVQYGLMRSRSPKRVIEVGCGWSSVLMAKALSRNEQKTHVTMIEPNPRDALLKRLPPDWTLKTHMLQRVPLDLFTELEAGDVLFYDGSHVAKAASDVNWFFFRVLPRVNPGVLIHVHDIFFPGEYPEPWIFDRCQTWNEQYLLHAFLMHNEKYRVVIANRMLAALRRDEVERAYKGVRPAIGASFWMMKT
ncbi:MAG: class I SAM-dependent methyltransferase [Phycisphaeraceae bacterium]|nr:class I SAM-dependent methyltransferase [Phycisphaeraceae bacterium]